MAMDCPHCGSLMTTRTSRPISELSRESYLECTNLHCGHKCVAISEIKHSIVQPNFPNPRIHLPFKKPDDPRDPLRKPDSQPELF